MNRTALLLPLALLGCAPTATRGLDGEYTASNTLAISSAPRASLLEAGRLRVASSTDPEVDFVLTFSDGVGPAIDRCVINGRWTEAGADSFEVTRRVQCGVTGVDGLVSISFENDHADPITGTLTAGNDRNVWLALRGICHLTDGTAVSCNVDTSGVMR